MNGNYQLACGHAVKRDLDVLERQRCPKCQADTIVIRVLSESAAQGLKR